MIVDLILILSVGGSGAWAIYATQRLAHYKAAILNYEAFVDSIIVFVPPKVRKIYLQGIKGRYGVPDSPYFVDGSTSRIEEAAKP